MLKKLIRFIRDKSGATAIEYGLIAALIGVAIIGGATLLGQNINTLFEGVGTELSNSTPGGTTGTTTP